MSPTAVALAAEPRELSLAAAQRILTAMVWADLIEVAEIPQDQARGAAT